MTPADTFTAMLSAVDALDWQAFVACFDERIETDYTTLWGGEPETVSPSELSANWQALAPGYDATQHLTGPVLVTENGDEARGVTSVRAYHHIAELGTWMVSGRYEIGFRRTDAGWRINAITLVTYYEEGERVIVDRARQRVSEGHGGRC